MMRPIATDVARSMHACLSVRVGLFVGHRSRCRLGFQRPRTTSSIPVRYTSNRKRFSYCSKTLQWRSVMVVGNGTIP